MEKTEQVNANLTLLKQDHLVVFTTGQLLEENSKAFVDFEFEAQFVSNSKLFRFQRRSFPSAVKKVT